MCYQEKKISRNLIYNYKKTVSAMNLLTLSKIYSACLLSMETNSSHPLKSLSTIPISPKSPTSVESASLPSLLLRDPP